MKDNRHLTRIGFGVSLFLLVLLHFLKPEFNPLTRNLSEYANGKYGFLMILFFLFNALGFVGMAFHSYRIFTHRAYRAIASFLFLVCAFSAVILSIFPLNLIDSPSNTSSYIHIQTAPMFLISEIVAMTVFTIRLRFERPYKPHFLPTITYAVCTYLVFILFLLLVRDPNYTGLVQRMLGFSIWLWLMNSSFRLT
ncbi:MAG: DUF998 domain-containing protein [Bacteroidia bacterium]|nr:DUF998 domain-containing protein [Bacteroidia bacterium]